MKIKINYYGLIADLIGISDENFELNFNESNELDLRSIFNHKYPALLKINYKIALDTEFTETIKSIEQRLTSNTSSGDLSTSSQAFTTQSDFKILASKDRMDQK